MKDFSKRSSDVEIMDDFALQGPELDKTLKDLDKVNTWLGGNKITLEGIEKLIQSTCFSGPLRIIDVGCGNGSLLKEVADFGRKRGIEMKLTGIDANVHAIEIARKNTRSYENISFEAVDVFSEDFETRETDILLCTLTLHHFEDEKIILLLKRFINMSTLGIVINDLQRSKAAYYLFELFCAAFINNEIARKDGLVSIQKSFRKEDLLRYADHIEARKQEISWKWAFRYQWIIMK